MTDNRRQMTLHILSDSVGETADTVAHIVAIQFPQIQWKFAFTTMIDNVHMLREAILPHAGDDSYVFIYTFTNPDLREEMCVLRAPEENRDTVHSIDILASGLDAITTLTRELPSGKVGMLHQVDNAYYRRISAMEFAVRHDDGQHPEGLIDADIVLIGVSRTSKTPLSMYLAHRGFKTANIPLTLEATPPRQLFEIEADKIFGLMTGMDTLTKVRQERMNEFGAYVPNYTDPNYVEKEFESARTLMRQLGCLIINTEKRAIESVAQEIMTYLRMNFKGRFDN
ncbi:MAG: kinase/pyrophosphorylase [Coriobacteriia bacterium]|nr:kinase/pyrophosphorylase [Coriobacteriia bacterium]MCL2605910.1 kinase/pyrophosphorylase [Coriobacteriia bacterium]